MLFPPPLQTNSPPRVVITGAGIITALGAGWQPNAEGFRAGRVAIRHLTLFDVSRQRVKVAAQVDLPAALPSTHLSASVLRRMDRAGVLLLIAAHEAWQGAGLGPSEELPLVLGTTSGGMGLGESYYRHAIQAPHSRRQQATRVSHYQAQRQGLDLANAFGASGPITIIANACASVIPAIKSITVRFVCFSSLPASSIASR